MFGGFETWRPKRGPKIEETMGGPASKRAELESRRNALMTWMVRHSTPDDARLLEDINRQIQDLEM